MRSLLLLAAFAGVAFAETPADAVKREMALLEGEWTMVSGQRDGEVLPEEYVKTAKRVAKDGVSTVTINGMVVLETKFTVDPAKKPKTIDLTAVGEGKDGRIEGIYELDGDTVRFCIGEPGKGRPGEFTAKAGSGRTMSVWKRQAK